MDLTTTTTNYAEEQRKHFFYTLSYHGRSWGRCLQIKCWWSWLGSIYRILFPVTVDSSEPFPLFCLKLKQELNGRSIEVGLEMKNKMSVLLLFIKKKKKVFINIIKLYKWSRSCFKFKLFRVWPHWFVLYQWRADKGWLATYLILLPHMPALFVLSVSLTQTAGHTISALVSMLTRLWRIFFLFFIFYTNRVRYQVKNSHTCIEWKTAMYIHVPSKKQPHSCRFLRSGWTLFGKTGNFITEFWPPMQWPQCWKLG